MAGRAVEGPPRNTPVLFYAYGKALSQFGVALESG